MMQQFRTAVLGIWLGVAAVLPAAAQEATAPLAETAAAEGLGLAVPADPQTLAEIRAEIDLLRGEIDSLRQELVLNNPAFSGIANPGPLLDRVNALEEEIRRLTDQTEELRYRIEQVVTDGTNRIGDLEFRLTELEGGDFSSLGQTVPLGQGSTAPAAPAAPVPATPETAVPATPAPPSGSTRPILRGESGAAVAIAPAVPAPGEPLAPAAAASAAEAPLAAAPAVGGDAFEAALNAYRSGSYYEAERAFADYLATNPGGPRVGEAAFWRGEALAATGDWSRAARSYLDSFSGSPEGPKAPEALYRLGVSLGRLGQVQEACLTLSEVTNRYPSISEELRAQTESERRALACAG